MTLLEKIDIVLKKYNNGKDNEYSSEFKITLKDCDVGIIPSDQNLEETILYSTDPNIYFCYSIRELIGICILDNNPDLFKQD